MRELREHGASVFFTIDAGPSSRRSAIRGPPDRVADELAAIPGVVEILRCGLGDGTRVVTE